MTSTAAILASDFSHSAADVLHRQWTVGKMAHVIAALDGAPVAITVDSGSGHTLIGVQLVAVFNGGPSRGDRVTVKMILSDGTEQTTNYFLPSIGEAIIPLTSDGSKAKWTALDSERAQKSQAIRVAQAEHGDCEGRSWGKWEARPINLNEVQVTYTPHTGNPAFADQWGTRWFGTIRTDAPVAV